MLQDNFATNLKTTKLEELNKFTGIKNFKNSDKKNIIEIYKNHLYMNQIFVKITK